MPQFALYKGIEPLSSGRKPSALTTMLIELIAVHTRIELVSPERQSGRIAITPMNQIVHLPGFEPRLKD